ncbi:type I toxin-antitoxin system Hok family toxin [Escherichia coli]|nr:type I toxin-antitoxin system Hok family toxin [Escherichia coli]
MRRCEPPRVSWRVICLTVIVTALVTRKDLCEVRIRTGQTEVAVFTAYEPEE